MIMIKVLSLCASSASVMVATCSLMVAHSKRMQIDNARRLLTLFGPIIDYIFLRFESQQLSRNNMARLLPLLRRWVEDVERDAAEVQTKTSAAIEVNKRNLSY